MARLKLRRVLEKGSPGERAGTPPDKREASEHGGRV